VEVLSDIAGEKAAVEKEKRRSACSQG